jgi:hypothetical protein
MEPVSNPQYPEANLFSISEIAKLLYHSTYNASRDESHLFARLLAGEITSSGGRKLVNGIAPQLSMDKGGGKASAGHPGYEKDMMNTVLITGSNQEVKWLELLCAVCEQFK